MIPQNVTLLPDDWADAKRKAHEIGQRSTSAGLRAIIAEWRRLRAGLLVDPAPDYDPSPDKAPR